MSTTSTSMISGLASGLDWRNIVDQIREVEHKKIDLIENQKSEYESKLSAWQDINTKLLTFMTSAKDLKTESAFNVYTTSSSSSSTTDADDILTADVGTSANPATYSIEVIQTARNQKLSSKSFTSQSTALGASYAGAFTINGRSITVSSTDTLVNVRDMINNVNSGDNASKVTASIVSSSSTDYRLIFTSDDQGSEGLGIQQVGSDNTLEAFGLISSTDTIKHSTSDGAKSDTFSSAGSSISSLLGLSSSPTGNVTIGGQAVTIDLSKTLTQIASDIEALSGVTAEVVSSTVDGETVYQIDISGTTSFTDANNVLQTLGVLRGTYSNVQETHASDTANTKTTVAGGGVVTAATTWGGINTGGDANNVTNNDTITISGTNHAGTAVSAGTYTITNKATDTIQGLLTQIDTLFGLTAGSATVTAEGKIQIADSTSGDSALSVTLISNNQGGGDLNLGVFTASQQGYSMETQSGRDANIKVDGNYMTRTSNTITDAITGVTLDLIKAESGTTVTLAVNRDIDGIAQKITGLVDNYNSVMSIIQSHMSYDSEEEKTGGVLFGDGTLSSVKSDLMSNIITQISGVSSNFSIPGMVGIELDKEGQLSVDDSTLKGYLNSNFTDVRNLFIANGTTSIGTLAYSTHGLSTKPGTYTVNITQAATQGSVTGTTDLSGGLGSDDTLTISMGSASTTISLTAGMTLTQIVNTINSELDTEYAETIVGDEVLYADAGMTTKITNSTTWANVYDDLGVTAGLQNGDVISFNGTTRSGTSASGSYTITNKNTDTVQGLLSAIETAYDNTVIASINSNGKITLTDKSAGTSSITLSITNPTSRNLNFGAIDIDPTGADGSHEGRYAIPITASASAGNNLVLTTDNYGSSSSFTLSQTNDVVLGAAKDGTYAGVDIAGTINGEAATGSGQTLTGDSDDANVDGLVIQYTGASTGSVGTVTLTLGIAENFYKSLFYITDSYDGYVGFKQTSLQDNIDRLETRITDEESSLDRKMESMIKQFISMEMALSKLQSQSSWMTSQINALSQGW